MVTPLKEKDPFLGLDPQFDNAGQAVDSDPFAGLDPQFDNAGQAVDSDPFAGLDPQFDNAGQAVDSDPFADLLPEKEDRFQQLLPRGSSAPPQTFDKGTRDELNALNGNVGNKEYMYIPGENVVTFNEFGISKAIEILSRAYSTGNLGSERSQLGHRAMNGDTSVEARISEIDDLLRGFDPLAGMVPPPLTEEELRYPQRPGFVGPDQFERINQFSQPPKDGIATWLGKTVFEELANIRGYMSSGLIKGSATGGAMLLATAIPGPHQAVTGPLSIPMFGAGFTAGAIEYGYRQMSGEAYLEYRAFTDDEGNKLPDHIAKLGAVIMGGFGAGMESISMGMLFKILPGTRQVFKKAGFKVSDALKIPSSTKLIKEFLFNMAQISLTEGGTEGGQEILQIGIGEILKANADGEFEAIDFTDAAARVADAAKKGATIGALLGGGATAASVGVDVAQGKGDLIKTMQSMKENQQESTELFLEQRALKEKGKDLSKKKKSRMAELEGEGTRLQKEFFEQLQAEQDKQLKSDLKKGIEALEDVTPEDLTPEVTAEAVEKVETITKGVQVEEESGKISRLQEGVRSTQEAGEGGKFTFEGEEKEHEVGGLLEFQGFHGTSKEGLPVKDVTNFGGFHAGTEKAAQDRVGLEAESTRASTGKKIKQNIIPVNIKLNKTLGTLENPIDETTLFTIVNLKNKLKELKDQGFDGIIYKNITEDSGSISILSFSSENVSESEVSKVPEVDTLAKVEEALQGIAKSPEVRALLIKARIAFLERETKNIDIRIDALNTEIAKAKANRKNTKGLESKKEKLLKKSAKVEADLDNTFILGLANDLKLSKKAAPLKVKAEKAENIEEQRVNEAKLILEELGQGDEPQNTTIVNEAGEQVPVLTQSTNPAFLSGRADLEADPLALNVVGLKQGGKKPNRRSKKAVMNAVQRIINGKPAPKDKAQAALHNRILDLIEDRLAGEQPRFVPGTGQAEEFAKGFAEPLPEILSQDEKIKNLFDSLKNKELLAQEQIEPEAIVELTAGKVQKLEEQSLKAQEKALKKGFTQGAKATKDKIKQAKKNLRDLLNSTSLPPESKNKIMTLAKIDKKIQSADGFVGALKEIKSLIRTEFERLAFKEQSTRLTKLLSAKSINPKVVSGVRKGKFTADIQERLEELRSLLKKGRRVDPETGEALTEFSEAEITALEVDIEALEQFNNLGELYGNKNRAVPNEKTGISPAQAELNSRQLKQQEDGIFDPLGNAILEFRANPKNFTSAQLKKIADEVEGLITEGKNAAKERVNGRKLRNEGLASNAADTIRTVEEQLLIDDNALQQRIIDFNKKINNLRRYAAENWQGQVDIAFNLKGVDNDLIIEALNIREELAEAIRLQNQFGNDYRDRIKRSIGTVSDIVYNKKMIKDHKRFNAGKLLIKQGFRDASEGDKFVNAKGQPVVLNLSIAEIRNYKLTEQQTKSHETLFAEDGNAFVETTEDKIGTLDELYQLLDENDLAIIEARLDMMEELYDLHNEVYRKLNGINLKRNDVGEGRYFPWSRTTGGRDVLGIDNDQAMRATVNLSSHKARSANRFEFKPTSDEAVMQRHLFEVSHYIATADKLTNIRQIITNTKLKKAIESKFGKGLYSQMAETVTDFIRGRVERGKALDKAINEMNSRFAASVLRLKPIIGVKQLLSIPAYLEKMPVHAFIAGELDFIVKAVDDLAHGRKNRAIEILKEVPAIANRAPNPEVAIANIAQDIQNIKQSLQRGTRWSKLMDANIKIGDIGAIYAGGWALYKYSLSQGKTKAQALKIVQDTTLDRQQSQALNQLSPLQRGHSLGRSLTAFSSAPLSYLRAEFQALRQGFRRKISPYQAGRQFAIYHFLLPMIWQFVADGFKVDKEHLWRAAFLGNLNAIALIGDLFQAFYNMAFELKAFDVEAIPFLAFTDDMIRGMGDIMESGLEIDSEEFYDAVKRFASAYGKVTRKPVQQFFNIYEGISEIADDGLSKEPLLQTLGAPPLKN